MSVQKQSVLPLGMSVLKQLLVVHFDLQISPRIFEKTRNGTIEIIRDLGEADSWKNTGSKISRDTVPLIQESTVFSFFDQIQDIQIPAVKEGP